MITNVATICIGIPTCNRHNLLNRALASIAQQQEKPDEVIIGDNSDNKKSEEVYKSFKARIPNLHYIKNQNNFSAFDNFLNLTQITSMTHFMWLADDDVLEEDHLKTIKKYLHLNPSIQYLGWSYKVINYVNKTEEHPSYLPEVNLSKGAFANISSYLKQPISCYFYGLYNRESLSRTPLKYWHDNNISFDWMDVAFVMYNIINNNSHFLKEQLVIYGIDSPTRPRKGANGQIVKAYNPYPWLYYGILMLLRCKRISFIQRARLLIKFVYAWKKTTNHST
jgi:glycosyltransferase involved in cell wall biosynthesis